VGIMEWTGPGVWTDSVLRYLRIKYGVRWTDLRRLAKPLRVGEVVILPITGFSPGVGNFGAMSAKREWQNTFHLAPLLVSDLVRSLS
jgi:alpha 1,6-mannosyltransferase